MLLEEPSIQMSARELRHALTKKLFAFEIDSYWRIISDEYLWDLLQDIFLTAEEHTWSLDAIPIVDLIGALTASSALDQRDLTRLSLCVAQVLRKYGHKIKAASRGGAPIWGLNFGAISALLGQMLLRLKPRWTWAEFTAAIVARLPDEAKGFAIAHALFFGHAVFSRPRKDPLSQTSEQDHALPADALEALSEPDLPADPRLRFRALFQKQPVWKDEELVPFIQPLVTPASDLNSLLVKHSRSVLSPQGFRLYYPR